MTTKTITSVEELKKIFSEKKLEKFSDKFLEMQIEMAALEIETFLQRKLADDEFEHPRVKMAVKYFFKNFLDSEWSETHGMTSFKQGNISVSYESSEVKKNTKEYEIVKILMPLKKVKIWS